jgi:hypothetical protein
MANTSTNEVSIGIADIENNAFVFYLCHFIHSNITRIVTHPPKKERVWLTHDKYSFLIVISSYIVHTISVVVEIVDSLRVLNCKS